MHRCATRSGGPRCWSCRHPPRARPRVARPYGSPCSPPWPSLPRSPSSRGVRPHPAVAGLSLPPQCRRHRWPRACFSHPGALASGRGRPRPGKPLPTASASPRATAWPAWRLRARSPCVWNAMSAATVALADPKQAIVYLEKGRLLARLDRQPAGRALPGTHRPGRGASGGHAFLRGHLG